MNGKPFFDTNLLIYALAEGDPRAETARTLLSQGGVISVQILNEFVAAARRKLKMSWEEVQEALRAFRVFCRKPVPLSIETHEGALRIAERYGYGIYDSLVIAAALEAACPVLYSEDMRNGQRIGSLAIRNPF